MSDTPRQTLAVSVLMRGARERGYSIEAVFDTVLAHLPSEIDARRIQVPFAVRGVLGRLRAMRFARTACRGSDVVHMTGDEHFLVALLSRRRTILTIHDCEVLDRARGLKRLVLWLAWFWLPTRRVAYVTTVSALTREDLLRRVKIDPGRVLVIENPLSKPLVRVDRAFNADRPTVLMLGTAPHKNLERAVESLAGLSLRVRVIGRIDPARLARLRATGVDLEAAWDLTDAELARAYAEADLLLFPSLAEGFGLPIIEAQAVGRPVITSAREPMRGVAGDGALLVDPESTAEIRAAVQRVVADAGLRARLVDAGFANVARFDPGAVAERYAALYRRVAAEARGR